MSWDDYEAITETLELVGDETALDQLREGLLDVEAGPTISWEEAKKNL